MKRIIKRCLESLGFRIDRCGLIPDDFFDIILKQALDPSALHRRPVVVQIGANDGVSNDPVHSHISKSHDITAVFVEPQPDAFSALQKNYSTFTNCVFVNAAIDRYEKPVTMYRIKPQYWKEYKRIYKSWANPSGITSMDRNHVKSFLKKVAPSYFSNHDPDAWIEEIVVPVMNFSSLLGKAGISEIDVLQIDAEGYDYEILDMALSVDIKPPRVINLEVKNIQQVDKANSKQRLLEMGYCVWENKGDLCAFRSLLLA